MSGGNVTFKGGTISNTKAVRACLSRLCFASHVANARALRSMSGMTVRAT
jgi:hypothetical protein